MREFTHRQWPLEIEPADDEVTVGYAVGFQCRYDAERGLAAIDTSLDILVRDDDKYTEEKPHVLAELETVTVFEVVEDEGVDRSQPVALDFVANIIGISYSTARGILIGRIPHERLEQSPAPAIRPREIAADLDLDWVEGASPAA